MYVKRFYVLTSDRYYVKQDLKRTITHHLYTINTCRFSFETKHRAFFLISIQENRSRFFSSPFLSRGV